jgi:hypothetical protein
VTRRERHAIYEFVALAATALVLALAAPTLLDAHGIVRIGGELLFLAWSVWGGSFVYRSFRQ